MNSYYEKNPRLRNPFHGCALCRAQQQFRDDVSTVLVASPSRLLSIREKVGAGDRAAVREFQTIADLSGHSSEREAAWCAFTQAMDSFDEDYIFHVDDRQQFESDYQTLVETK